jgi:outer membrane lipoprotein-sorting protein
MDFSQAPPDPVEQSRYIEQFQPTIVGSEVVNGKDCLVFEWTAEGTQTKWWLDKDSGWPVRIESKTPQGTMRIDYTNIQFTNIPDSEFEFPAECEQ